MEQIASLTVSDIARLDYDEMVDLVAASELPVVDSRRLQSMESDILVRLAYAACEHCRLEVADREY